MEDIVPTSPAAKAALPPSAMPVASTSRSQFMRPIVGSLFTILGFHFGSSPLVLPVAQRFAGGGGEDTGDGASSYAGGLYLYGFAWYFALVCITGAVESVILEARPHLQPWAKGTALVAWPVALVGLALSVHVESIFGLFVAFGVMGFSIGTVGQWSLHVEMPLVWGEEITKGHAITGCAIGLGALFWTFLLGEITHKLGQDRVALVIGIAACVSAASMAVIFLTLKPLQQRPTHVFSSDKRDGAVLETTSLTKGRPLSTLLLDWRVWVYIFVIDVFTFCGLSMKMLLSTIFEKALGISYVGATRMSALCLLAYVPGRGLTPLFASQDRVFVVFLVVLMFETLAYALTPWAISLGVEGDGDNATPLVVYTLLRVLSGGGFAVLLGNIGVLSVRVFGARDVPGVVTLWASTMWIAGIGPSLAWAIHVELRNGDDSKNSFDVFFYLCAALTLLAAGGVAILARWPSPTLRPKRPITYAI